MSKALALTDTTFRDAHQSLLATRLEIEDMEPIISSMDKIGFHSMEVWGGATFDAATRFLSEDPWERLRIFKTHALETPLSMLLRGQSLVGYRAYADDIVDAFIERAAINGIDIFRVFDALNDEWNLSQAARAVRRVGKHLQMTICYSVSEGSQMGGPIYNLEYYLSKAQLFESMGADSICLKDMAGIMAPYDAYELISRLKQETNIPIQLHTHYTSGMASMTIIKAIEAGIDIVDTCLAPLALRTSQPAVEPLVMTLRNSERDPKIDLDKLIEHGNYLESILPKYRNHLDNSKFSVIDTKVLSHQVPGGMSSNLASQLREGGAIDRIDEVLEEIANTRRDLGSPPLVTPMSQMVGSQAVNNVLFGRYQMVSDPVKDYVRGMYGRPPGEMDSALTDLVLNETGSIKKPLITGRPADELSNELEQAREEIKHITEDLDDVLTYALYPTTGLKFLKHKYGLEVTPADQSSAPEIKIVKPTPQEADGNIPEKSNQVRSFNVFVDGEFFQVEVDPANNFKQDLTTMKSNRDDSKITRSSEVISENELRSPMPGILLRYLVDVGQEVALGEPIAVLEAMKMENALPSPCDGTVLSLPVKPGNTITKDEVIAKIV